MKSRHQTEEAGGAPAKGRYVSGSYTYSYDGGRLTKAEYRETGRVEGSPGALAVTEVAVDPDYSAEYCYDSDGNITLMSRNGVFERTAGGLSGGGLGGITLGGSPGLGGSSIQPASKTYANVDNISLSYEGGQLVRADDAGWDCTLSIATDWSEQTQTAREYTYDVDGRMTSDKNKGITSITYNVLGLPETLSTAGGVIRNTYDADGRLVRRSYGTMEWVTTDLGFTSHTYQAYREERRVDYVGELILEDGAVYRRTHEAGWTDAQRREVAAVHDYRGSLRATWTDTSTGNATLGGTTAPFIPGASAGTKIYGNLTGYYPYGLPWADWQGSDRYLFSGKELEREHGLFTYDFHARPYDPGLCRFTQPDPMTTSNPRVNSFAFCSADPINRIDPTGKKDYYNSVGKHLWYDGVNNGISIMLFGAQNKNEPIEDYCKRAVDDGMSIVISKEALDALNNAATAANNSNKETMYWVYPDGHVSDVEEGGSWENGRFTVQINPEKAKGAYWDFHSHPYFMQDNKIFFGFDYPSEADKKSSGTQANGLIYFKEETHYDPNMVGSGSESERVPYFQLYNENGTIPNTEMKFSSIKRRIQTALDKQNKLDKERDNEK